MTNICQAIEEELMRISLAEANGVDMYETQSPTGVMTLDLWRQMLSNPETLRIETSLDFMETATDLLEESGTDFTEGYQFETMGKIFNSMFIATRGPVVMYIPDYQQKYPDGLEDSENYYPGDGVFVAYWLDKIVELYQFNREIKVEYSWVKPRSMNNVRNPYTNNRAGDLVLPMSYDDIPNDLTKQAAQVGLKDLDLSSLRTRLGDFHTGFVAVLHAMHQPNFVTQTTVGSSGVRKRLEKKKGIPKERWSRIQWNVGQQAQREVRETMGEEHCTALHRVRGFYRTAKSHYNNVKKIDGKWFQWIEPFWRGHPAFGIVKSSHAPQMEKK